MAALYAIAVGIDGFVQALQCGELALRLRQVGVCEICGVLQFLREDECACFDVVNNVRNTIARALLSLYRF